MDDLNGFSKLVQVSGRSWAQLKERMITEIRVPATVVQFGIESSGLNWAIVKLSAPEKASKAPKPKEQPIPDPVETVELKEEI